MRNILLQTNKTNVLELKPSDAFQIKYRPIDESDRWKPHQIMNLIDILHNVMELPGFERAEINEFINYLCTS